MTTLNNVRVGVIETQRLWVVFVSVWCCLSGSTDFNTTGASWSLIPWSIRPLQPGGTCHVLIRPAASSVTFTYIKGCENNGHRGSVLYLTQPVKDVSKWYSYMSQTNFTWSISLQLEFFVSFISAVMKDEQNPPFAVAGKCLFPETHWSLLKFDEIKANHSKNWKKKKRRF